MGQKLELTLAMGDYEIVRALKEGTVEPDGIKLNVLTKMDSTTRHWRFLRNQAFDVAVTFNSFHSLTEVFHGFLIELVNGLALKVKLQFGDAVVKQLYAYGVALIDHSFCSPVPKYAV